MVKGVVIPRAALFFVLSLSCSIGSQAFAADDVWALLKKPGHIILLRHSNAPETVTESDDMDMKNCAIQRNLDAEGRAQAARVGDEFRKHKIKSVRLVASEYCRAVETGKLTKLGPVTQLRTLNLVYIGNVAAMREAGAKTRAFMKTIPANQLTMLVTHVGNIMAIANAKLDSGEMAVVHLDPAGEVVVDGRISVP
jgi:phosphohistidine phosphatase SixA